MSGELVGYLVAYSRMGSVDADQFFESWNCDRDDYALQCAIARVAELRATARPQDTYRVVEVREMEDVE